LPALVWRSGLLAGAPGGVYQSNLWACQMLLGFVVTPEVAARLRLGSGVGRSRDRERVTMRT